MDLVGFVSKTVLTFLPTTSAREVMQSPLSVCVHSDNFWNEWPLTPFACTVYGFDHDGSEIHTMPHFHCPARLHRNTEVRRQIRVSCSSKLSGTSVLHRGQFSNCLSKCKKNASFYVSWLSCQPVAHVLSNTDCSLLALDTAKGNFGKVTPVTFCTTVAFCVSCLYCWITSCFQPSLHADRLFVLLHHRGWGEVRSSERDRKWLSSQATMWQISMKHYARSFREKENYFKL